VDTHLVTKQILRASSHIQLIQTSNNNPNSPALITQFHPKLTKVKHYHFHILKSDPDKRSVFSTRPRLVFQHSSYLRNILVQVLQRSLLQMPCLG